MPVNSFIESPRFNEDISYGSSGGPKFKTHVFEGSSGREQRNVSWSHARGEWNISHGVRDTQDMDEIRRFFFNVKGRAVGFRFKDHSDYQVIDSVIGTGDSTDGSTGTSDFEIFKTYDIGTSTYQRRIYKPVADSTETPIIVTVNSIVVDSVNYTVDTVNGILQFNSGNHPLVGEPVVISCHFDVPVRFDTDHLSSSHDGFRTESWSSIPIVELITGI